MLLRGVATDILIEKWLETELELGTHWSELMSILTIICVAFSKLQKLWAYISLFNELKRLYTAIGLLGIK